MTSDDAKTHASGRELRRAERSQAVELIWFKTLGNQSKTAIEGVSKMRDLSATGIGLYVTQPLAIGELVFVEIASINIRMSAVGTVVFQKQTAKNRYRIGVNFDVIPPNDRMAITRFLKDQNTPQDTTEQSRRDSTGKISIP